VAYLERGEWLHERYVGQRSVVWIGHDFDSTFLCQHRRGLLAPVRVPGPAYTPQPSLTGRTYLYTHGPFSSSASHSSPIAQNLTRLAPAHDCTAPLRPPHFYLSTIWPPSPSQAISRPRLGNHALPLPSLDVVERAEEVPLGVLEALLVAALGVRR